MSRSDQRIAILGALSLHEDLTPSQILSKTRECACGPFSLFEVNGELFHLTTEGYILRTPDDRGKGIHPKFRITNSGEDHLGDWEAKQPGYQTSSEYWASQGKPDPLYEF